MKRAIIIAAILAAGIAHGQMFAQMFGATSTARLPAEYQEVEYLEAAPAGPYVRTGINPSLRTTEMSVRLMPTATSSRMFGCSAYTNGVSGTVYRYRAYETGTAFMGLSIGDAAYNVAPPTIGNVYTVAFSGGVISVNGSSVATYAGPNYTLNREIVLFGEHGENGSYVASACRIYAATIGADRNYVPARRIADNVLGMYDLINNTFWTNDGTGSFTAGPDVD